MLSDTVVRVTLTYKGVVYPRRWYYNLTKASAIKRCKALYNLQRKHGVEVAVD